MPKYSFVIPVYKAEKYLEACLNSICEQTYEDYEIVLVDDGSPDRSGAMCDELAEKNGKLRVLHQKNAGASAARNAGVRAANGEIVIFLDSDDFWCDRSGLEKINCLFGDSVDMVVFASKDYYEDTGKWIDDRYDYPAELNTLGPEECLKYLVSHDRLNVHPGKRAIRRAFIIGNGLRFCEGIRTEDVEASFRVADCLPCVRFLNEKLYVYRHHEGSVTATMGASHLKEYGDIIEKYVDYPFRNETVETCMKSYLAYQYALFLAFNEKLKLTGYAENREAFRKYRFLLNYRTYPRTAAIAKAMKVLGYTLTCKALALYLNRR